jgi:hypothetical protein
MIRKEGYRQPSDDRRYVIYQWLTSEGFLLRSVIPNATVLDAGVHDTPDGVISAIPTDATHFHFHLNCTRTHRFPTAREALLDQLRKRGIAPVNDAVTDISKTFIQECCSAIGINTTRATRNGAAKDLIIVKTDLNFGGDSEWGLSEEDRSAAQAGAGSSVMWKPDDYLVAPRASVPDAYWDDPTLVRERFVSNQDGRWYRCFIFHSRACVCELVSQEKVKKLWSSTVNGTWMFEFDEVVTRQAEQAAFPPRIHRVANDLIRFVRSFSLDFGAVDIVMDDADEPFVIDVNTTPAYNYPINNLVDFLRGSPKIA